MVDMEGNPVSLVTSGASSPSTASWSLPQPLSPNRAKPMIPSRELVDSSFIICILVRILPVPILRSVRIEPASAGRCCSIDASNAWPSHDGDSLHRADSDEGGQEDQPFSPNPALQ